MPSSRVFAFADPIEFQETIRAAEVTVVPTARGEFRAELTRIDFDRLWMQRVTESAPVVKHSEIHVERAPILFLTRSDEPTIRHGGADLSSNEIVVYGLGASIHHKSAGPCRWGAMSLAPDDLADTAYALVGRELLPPPTQFAYGRTLRSLLI